MPSRSDEPKPTDGVLAFGWQENRLAGDTHDDEVPALTTSKTYAVAVPAEATPILEVNARTGVSTTDPRAGMGIGKPGDPMYTLQATKQHGVAYQLNIRGRSDGANLEIGEPDVATTLRAGDGGSSRGNTVFTPELAVRRLTPRECERLMGWPDDWTLLGDDDVEIAMSHRYRMCGNGVASPVAEFVGRCIVDAHEALNAPQPSQVLPQSARVTTDLDGVAPTLTASASETRGGSEGPVILAPPQKVRSVVPAVLAGIERELASTTVAWSIVENQQSLVWLKESVSGVTGGGGKPGQGYAAVLIQKTYPIQDGRDIKKGQNGLGVGSESDPMYTLDTTGGQSVAIAVDAYNQSADDKVFPALRGGEGGGDIRATVYVSGMVNMQGSKGNAVVNDGTESYSLNAMHGHDVHAVGVSDRPNQIWSL